MRKQVRKACGIDDENDPDLSTPEIDLYLNLAYWEIQDKFPFREKEKTATFQTVIGTRNYNVPQPFEALQSLAIVDPVSGKHVPLDRMGDDEYEQSYIEGESHYGQPERYLREGCFVRLYPTPDKVYTIVLRRLITLTDISDTRTTPEIPRAWWEIITLGGQYRALLDLGDIKKSNYYMNLQTAKINGMVPTEAKEAVDSQRAGLEVIREDNYV
jgi:hypothetical protein